MTKWILPIEPLEHRYSADWLKWFKEKLTDPSRAMFIEGEELTTKIEQGSFLDVFGTHYYKSSQVQAVAKLMRSGEIKSGDEIVLLDAWFPLEQLYYMIEASGLEVKVTGVLHAGCYDPHDFLAKKLDNLWALTFEHAVFCRLDKVIVFSEFHKKLLLESFPDLKEHKIKVTPFPYDATGLDKYYSTTKDIDVVFPHRLDEEKSPWVVEIFKALERQKLFNFVSTAETAKTKEDYYKLLGRAKYAISWNKQETFGIAMAEAAYLGATPLCPNRLSYPELYGEERCFDALTDLIVAIRQGHLRGKTTGPFDDKSSIEKFFDCIGV